MTMEYRKEKTLTEEEVRQAVRYWQNKLRLNDWIIKSGVCRKKDLPEDTEARITYNLNKKIAYLYVLHQDDAEGDQPHDMEVLIIHELIHLHLAPLDWEDHEHGIDPHALEQVAEEQAVESITAALIVTERGQNRLTVPADDADKRIMEERNIYRERVAELTEKLKRVEKERDGIAAAEKRLIGDYNSLKDELRKLTDALQEEAKRGDENKRALNVMADTVKWVGKERDDQKEKFGRLHDDYEKLKAEIRDCQKLLESKDADLVTISKLREETLKENRRLKMALEDLREQRTKELRMSSAYQTGAEDAYRRHAGTNGMLAPELVEELNRTTPEEYRDDEPIPYEEEGDLYDDGSE